MVVGHVLLGIGAALIYRKIGTTAAERKIAPNLPVMINELGKAVGTQTTLILGLKREMDLISEKVTALQMMCERPTRL